MEWKTLLNNNRPRPTTSTGDYRDQFERDFDRAVFSTPVKRLQDKAQVFPLEPHDAVRTRLTHSLEVSSVARGIGIGVAKWLLAQKAIDAGMDRAIEAIAATCGLIHDLGNPPFGHAGEDAIRHWFESSFGREGLEKVLGTKDAQLVQDFLKFEGNAQSLRLVAKLQILADYHGLNLTFGTLSASCKYIAPSHLAGTVPDNQGMKKPGYFASENALVKQIRAETGTGDARNPITFLVEAADDIVYSVADIEDGIKKGILDWPRLKEEITRDRNPVIEDTIQRMERILKAGAASIPEGLPDDVYGSAFRTAAISKLVPSVIETFKANYGEIMAGRYNGELAMACDSAALIERLKVIGTSRVYCTAPTLKLEIMGRKVIGDLMTVFWEGASKLPTDKPPKTKAFAGKIGALLSENYRRVFQHFVQSNKELPEAYHRFQLVTDYVCGMTDSFAKRLHAELTNGS